jgi:hypothetical protein
MCPAITLMFSFTGSHIFLITNIEQDMANLRQKEILLLCITKLDIHSTSRHSAYKQELTSQSNHQCITIRIYIMHQKERKILHPIQHTSSSVNSSFLFSDQFLKNQCRRQKISNALHRKELSLHAEDLHHFIMSWHALGFYDFLIILSNVYVFSYKLGPCIYSHCGLIVVPIFPT